MLEELPTDAMQVLCIYAYSIFIVGWTLTMMTGNMSGIARFLLITAAIALPHAVRFLVRKLQG